MSALVKQATWIESRKGSHCEKQPRISCFYQNPDGNPNCLLTLTKDGPLFMNVIKIWETHIKERKTIYLI